jgi:hypothetical protein
MTTRSSINVKPRALGRSAETDGCRFGNRFILARQSYLATQRCATSAAPGARLWSQTQPQHVRTPSRPHFQTCEARSTAFADAKKPGGHQKAPKGTFWHRNSRDVKKCHSRREASGPGSRRFVVQALAGSECRGRGARA